MLVVHPGHYAAGLVNSLSFRPAAGFYGMHIIFPIVADIALDSPILAIARMLLRDTMTPKHIAKIITALKTAEDLADVRAVCEKLEGYNPPLPRYGYAPKSFTLRASEFAVLIPHIAKCPKKYRPTIFAARALLTDSMSPRDYVNILVAAAKVAPTPGIRELFPAILALAQKSVLDTYRMANSGIYCLLLSHVVANLMAHVAKVAPAARQRTYARLLRIAEDTN